MSSVPESRREPHDFQASHKLIWLRKFITELAINDFGYDKVRLEKKIERFEQSLRGCENKDEVVARMRKKNESFYEDFIREEEVETRRILREAVEEFEVGNNIFPSGAAVFTEFCERRKHLDLAIGRLNCLKQELQYIADVLPGDKNRYDDVIKEIKVEISLIKGVRRAANKFLEDDREKRKKKKKPKEEPKK